MNYIFSYFVFGLLCSIIKTASDLEDYNLYLRCDDYCVNITVDDVEISSFTPSTVQYTFDNYIIKAKKGCKLSIVVKNESGPVGLAAIITITKSGRTEIITKTTNNLFWYPVDNSTALDCNGCIYNNNEFKMIESIRDCQQDEIHTYHFVFPYTIEADSFTIYPKEGDYGKTLVNLAEHTHSECDNFMRFKIYNTPVLGKFIYINPTNNVIVDISTSNRNDFDYYYKFHHHQIYFEIDADKLNSNQMETIRYTVHDHQSMAIKSGEAYINIVVCDYRGSNRCEQRGSEIYYERCKEGYYFLEREHNICVNEDIKKNNYLDKTGDVYLYKPCYTSCKSCNEYATYLEGENNYLHKCTSCATGYYPIDNIPGVCLKNSEVTSDFKRINLVWTTQTENKIYRNSNGQYSSLDDTKCKGDYPYLLENTNLCIKSCISNNLYTLNGVCVHECPNNYILYSLDNICVEKTLLIPNNTDGILYSQENLDYIITNFEYNMLFYQTLKSPFHGNSYSIQTISLSEHYTKNHNINHSYIDFYTCENIIRKEQNIPSNIDLVIAIIDIHKQNEITNQIEYALFTSQGKRIDISSCYDTAINISYPIKNNSNLYLHYDKKFANDGINIYNISSPFYNDICSNYTFNNNDLVLKDRKRLSTIINLCEYGCNYININHTNNKVICSCKVKTNIHTQIITDPYTNNINVNDNKVPSYIFIAKCYSEFFIWDKLKANFNFYINVISMAIHICLVCLFFGIEHRKIRQQLFLINSLAKNKDRNDSINNNLEYSGTNSSDNSREVEKCHINIIIEKADPNMPLNTYHHEDTNVSENSQKQKEDKNTLNQKLKQIPYDGGFVARMLFLGNSKCFLCRMCNFTIINVHFKATIHTMFISLFVFEITTLYFFSMFFISNDTLSIKFHKNGNFPIDRMIGYVFICYLCKEIIICLLKWCISFTKIFHIIDHLGDCHTLSKHKSKVNIMNVRLVLMFFIEELFTLFYLYYSSLFEAIYPCSCGDVWLIFVCVFLLDVFMNFLYMLIYTFLLYAIQKCQMKKTQSKNGKDSKKK